MRRILALFVSTIVMCAAPCVSHNASAQEGKTEAFAVNNIEVTGNSRIDAGAIETQIRSQRGRLDRQQVSEDIKTLYRTGFFDQVTASLVNVSGGTGTLRFVVVEKPLVRKLLVSGNDGVSEESLAEVFRLENKRFLDKGKIEGMMRNAVSYYQLQGYYDATVGYSVAPVGDNQVDVTFKINEGERYKIREIELRGVDQLDEGDVLDAAQTKEYNWWSSWLFGTGRLNKEMLENDRNLMRQFFLDKGYVDATLSEPRVEKRDDGIYISFDVVEGDEYEVGRVTAQGDLIDNDIAETLDGIKSEAGETFGASKLRDDAFKVSDKFSDIGYAFVNVSPDTAIRKEEKKIDINFNINKGNLVTVNRINIRGNEKTYDNVIRRELKIGEQELFSSKKIKRSQTLLQRLGYFEEVNIAQEPTASQDAVDLLVNVREASTGQFSIGAGYASGDGPIFSARVTENNLFGTGRRLNLLGEIGTQRDNINLSLEDRRINDSYVSSIIEATRTRRVFTDFDRTLQGGGLTFGYPMEQIFGETAEDIGMYLKYEYLSIDISDVDPANAAPLVIQSEGESTVGGITPSIVRNTVNNPLNPTKGSKQVVSYEVTGFGGNQDYFLVEAKNQWYYPMLQTEFGEFVFSLRTSFGYGESNNDDPFPLFRRYFPGGVNSVRGYKNRTLGPTDAQGNEFGGSKQLVHNTEIIFPLINSAGFRGVIFHDAGEAFDDEQSIELGELRQSYGFGVRWASPLGPIRLEVGFPINREEGEKAMVPQFSFGAPF